MAEPDYDPAKVFEIKNPEKAVTEIQYKFKVYLCTELWFSLYQNNYNYYAAIIRILSRWRYFDAEMLRRWLSWNQWFNISSHPNEDIIITRAALRSCSRFKKKTGGSRIFAFTVTWERKNNHHQYICNASEALTLQRVRHLQLWTSTR